MKELCESISNPAHAALWILVLSLEAWLGKTDRVPAGSILGLIILVMKTIIQTTWRKLWKKHTT